MWSTRGDTYALGGMACDNGYLVFGNDKNHLYVVTSPGRVTRPGDRIFPYSREVKELMKRRLLSPVPGPDPAPVPVRPHRLGPGAYKRANQVCHRPDRLYR